MENNKSEIKTQEYDPGSLWEHLLFGVGGIAVMIPPLLIPGLSVKSWVLGLFGIVIVFYIIVCLLGIWKGLVR